jgi:hypothetical protein
MGAAAGKYADAVYEAQERQEVTDVHTKLAKARADWTVQLQERANQTDPGDATFAPKFNEDFSKYMGDLQGNLQTKGAQQAFQRGAADLSAHFVEQSGLYQAKAMGAKAKQDYLVSLDANRSTLISDPTQFGAVLQQMQAAINDPSGLYAKMPVADRQALEIQTKKELALSAVQGLVQNGAPELAKRQLMDGKWDTYLDADKKHQLLAEAEVGIKAKDTAAERQRLLAEREKKERQDQVMSTFLARIVDPKNNGGALPDKEILANTDLTAAEKQHFIDYKMRRARELAANHDSRTNPGEVRKLLTDIYANPDDPNKVYNADDAFAAYKAGRISTNELMLVRREVEQLRTGSNNGFQRDVQRARSTVHDAMMRSIEGGVSPDAAADASYRFSRDLETAIESKRKSNEDPRALLDPGSKEYFLTPTRIKSYMPDSRAAMAAAANDVRARSKAAGPNGQQGTLSAARRLPSYQDYSALKPGDQYTDPQGNVRTKGGK